MTYVDQSFTSYEITRDRMRLPDVRYWIAWAVVGLAAFFAYTAAERGATSSASFLLMCALAALGALIHQTWVAKIVAADRRLTDQGGLRRHLVNGCRRRAIDEVRLHQDILNRVIEHQGISRKERR